MESLFMALLECGSMDFSILDNVVYDLGEIADELIAEGVKPTLNAIMDMVFLKGKCELEDAIKDAIKYREEQKECIINDGGGAEYHRLQNEIDELEMVNPDVDMRWSFNFLDTSCWFSGNEEIYRKYIPEAIRNIEENMGFEF